MTVVPPVSISHGRTAFSTYDQAAGQNDYVETDVEVIQRENSDAMNEIIMAIDMKERGTIGCAYYVAREEKICLMDDIKMAGLETIETLKLQAQPTIILISIRSDEKLEEYLSRGARSIDRGDEASRLLTYWPQKVLTSISDNISGSYILNARPSSDFSYVAGKNKLINLELNSTEGPGIIFTAAGEELTTKVGLDQAHQARRTGRQGRLMKLGSLIDLDSKLTVSPLQ
jgi:DNA mismatch repair protein MSH5